MEVIKNFLSMCRIGILIFVSCIIFNCCGVVLDD